MANEEALRKQAIALYQQGKKVAAIAREIGRTRQWVHTVSYTHLTLPTKA